MSRISVVLEELHLGHLEDMGLSAGWEFVEKFSSTHISHLDSIWNISNPESLLIVT